MAQTKPLNQKYKLLEISLIKAYDLDPPTTNGLKIYAVIYIDPNRKLFSSALSDTTELAWANEKFLFVVDSETLESLTSARATVELYADIGSDESHVLLGRSRVLLGLLPNCGRSFTDSAIGAIREFHVRREDGRARGVLSLGFTVLEGLPLTDDKLVATGLALDCKTILRHSSDAFDGRKIVVQTVIGFFRSLIPRKFVH